MRYTSKFKGAEIDEKLASALVIPTIPIQLLTKIFDEETLSKEEFAELDRLTDNTPIIREKEEGSGAFFYFVTKSYNDVGATDAVYLTYIYALSIGAYTVHSDGSVEFTEK